MSLETENTQNSPEIGLNNTAENTPVTQPTPTKRIFKTILFTALFGLLLLVGIVLGYAGHFLRNGSFWSSITGIKNAVVDPRSGFPGQNKIVICCMGIDDNWTDKDVVFTSGARTDTLFLMSLDLINKKVSMLSIPRDTYVPIAGTHYSSKINSAYATGGPARTEATINTWLGVKPDYYLVLNIDATKKLVSALDGVDVNVEHQMDYDDNWGYLHVHLKPGFQHLDGDQAVGFARYRHGNHGISPEDGDERRMYRQHILLKAMVAQVKQPQNILNINSLIDTGISCVHTDLSRQQIADLASLFRSINQDSDIQTASLKGEDGKNKFGDYVMLVNQTDARLYCKWMLDGNDVAGRALTPIRIVNATATTGLAASARDQLMQAGYADARSSGNIQSDNPQETLIIDEGVPDKSAVKAIAASLGIANAILLDQPLKPNKNGWTPSPVVRIELGSDFTPTVGAHNAQATSIHKPISSS